MIILKLHGEAGAIQLLSVSLSHPVMDTKYSVANYIVDLEHIYMYISIKYYHI